MLKTGEFYDHKFWFLCHITSSLNFKIKLIKHVVFIKVFCNYDASIQ